MSKAVENAYRTIREGIIQGVYAQGSHITAQQLGETSGLSRTPVREAMRRLAAEGLLTLIPNRGAFVSSWTRGEIDQIYEVRILLEAYAAGVAAERAGPDDIALLYDLAERMRAEVRRDTVDHDLITEINSRFHQAVLDACGNARLRDLIASLTEMPLVLATFRTYSPEELRRSAAQHCELVDAIAAHDGSWAQAVMTAHIRSARQALIRRSLEQAGE
jgi:DNA-binding GntR family transcriptional regulator